jgi:3-oxoacyl-(acyl-carrier-protein) synthase
VFGRADETFRRLDATSRALVLAAEAAGIAAVLARVPAVAARDVGLVFETTLGSLDSDLAFAASLGAGMPDGPAFAYTLPSTCLGELALRHGLRGPTVCLTTVPADRGVALREAALLLATGEVPLAVAGLVDVLTTAHGDIPAQCRAVVALLAAPRLGLPPVAPWPVPGRDVYAQLAASLQSAAR